MMGVYIKGIKTPAIVKVHYLNGRRYVEDPQSGEWREMVDIPPHGRLIESAELYGKAEDIKTKALSMCDKSQSWQFGVFWAIEQIKAALTNAPTIIPAEEDINVPRKEKKQMGELKKNDYDGLRVKYTVRKVDTGELVDECFVLRPQKDKAAIAALYAYADATENKVLANDIRKWLDDSIILAAKEVDNG